MIEHSSFAGVILAGDIDAGLFVELPRWKAQVVGHGTCLLDDHTMGNKQGIDVTSHPRRVIGKRHRGSADNEQVRDNTTPDKALPQCGKSALPLGTPHQDAIGVAHAAARSCTER
jgi:hypothetical protein